MCNALKKYWVGPKKNPTTMPTTRTPPRVASTTINLVLVLVRPLLCFLPLHNRPPRLIPKHCRCLIKTMRFEVVLQIRPISSDENFRLPQHIHGATWTVVLLGVKQMSCLWMKIKWQTLSTILTLQMCSGPSLPRKLGLTIDLNLP